MIELAQHIEVLLLENDCVIVPGLGGFVAHYTPAMRVAEENVFLPPTRIIGFNPQLKMNDGLLVQSYMAVYDTDFSDATRIVEKEVAHIFTALHEEGKVDLPNIGELRYSIHGIYDFVPYDHKITTPYLYGLDSFEMQELAELKKPYMEKTIRYSVPVVPEDKKRRFEIKFNRSYLSNAVAMIAVVALFFFLSVLILLLSVSDQYPKVPARDSSSSIHCCTWIIRYSSLESRIYTRSIPALMIIRLHMEQLLEFLTYSPVSTSFPTRYNVLPIIFPLEALMMAFASACTLRQSS